jgi:hypothetical protein
MRRIRQHLTYANVMTTITAFVVLAGGTAFAAGQLAKNSVGKRQLKANAVTTAKIKRNAVTKPKIKNGAVDGSKIKDGSVGSAKVTDGSLTGSDVNAASMPFGRIVHEARGSSTVAVPTEAGKLAVFPLNGSTYTQEAGSDDSYVGAVDVTISSGCKEDRTAIAFLTVDSPNPLLPTAQDIVAWGLYEDEASSQVSARINLGPYIFGGVRFQPGSPTNHTLGLTLQGQCKTGTGITATSGAVDVIGTKK